MTTRQRLLSIIYPVWKVFAKLSGKHSMDAVNKGSVDPSRSFFELSFSTVDGRDISMASFRDKKILIVNTASECVYTTQYSDLQTLYEKFGEKLAVIAFPSNEFKHQEKGNDQEIAGFCTVNFGVRFPIAKKTIVRKREGQHPVFQWLTRTDMNGWNSQQPVWNFSKYLLDEKGKLTHIFGPPVSPMSDEILSAIKDVND
jgi:glutathione peroxidase